MSTDSRVVLYSLKDSLSPTARVYLTLDVMGLGTRPRFSMEGCRRGKRKTVSQSEARAPKSGKLEPSRRPMVIANADYVKANLKNAGVGEC